MSQRTVDQLAYAAAFDRAVMIYGAALDAEAAHREIEHATGGRVTFVDQRQALDATALRAALAKADKVHIAIGAIVTPELVAVLNDTLGRTGKRRLFTVLTTRAMVPSALGHDLRELFPVLIAWDEVL